MKMRNVLLLAVCAGLVTTQTHALNRKKFKAGFEQGQKSGAADAKESYPRDVNQHGDAASTSDGLDGQCYRSASDAAYDKAPHRPIA